MIKVFLTSEKNDKSMVLWLEDLGLVYPTLNLRMDSHGHAAGRSAFIFLTLIRVIRKNNVKTYTFSPYLHHILHPYIHLIFC